MVSRDALRRIVQGDLSSVRVVLGLIVIAVLGIAVFLLFGWLSKRVVGHWYEATRRRS